MKTNLNITRLILFFILSFLFIGANAQTTLFTEDWESAAIGQTPPSGWSIDLIAGTNHLKFDSAGWSPNCWPFSGGRLVEFQSLLLSSTCSNRLKRTTSVSTAGYPFVSVDFEWHSDSSSFSLTDRVEVQWSTNGSTWNTACTVYRASGTPFNDWVEESIGLPSGAANQATLYIAFVFSSDLGYNCHLDLVHIKGYATAPAVPTVNTTHATAITTSSATLNGYVIANGNSTTGYFQYGLTTSYGNTLFFSGNVTGNTMVQKIVSIDGLTINTTYHFRLVAFNAGGTTFGNDSVFTTSAMSPPTVNTTAASAITVNSAYLNGQVNANGSSTTVTFQYGLTTSYGTTLTYGVVGGNTLINVSSQATGLSPSTTYHYRCAGTNSYGTTYGSDLTFTTLPSGYAPTVITNAATNIQMTIATLNGHVNANGATTNVSFQYGLTTSYGSTVTTSPVNGNSLAPVSYTIFYLAPGAQYHYRCVGVNSFGTTYGNDTVFTTLPAAPSVNTGPAINISYTTATLTGTGVANGLTSTISFEYGLTSSYGSTIAGVPNTISGSSVYNITAGLTGLAPATLYHFVIKGTNSQGTTYGYDTTFMTLNPGVNPPTAITTQASNITAHQAVLGGIVNANGSLTNTYFEYGTSASYGHTVAAGDVTGNSNTPVSATVAGLPSNTLYHFRAMGTNAGGTSYGADSTFTTNDSVSSCHAAYTLWVNPANYLAVNFYDLSVGNPVSWNWNFGDPTTGIANTSTSQNPVHYFSAPGYYTVCLSIQGSDTNCYDTFCGALGIDTAITLHIYGTVTDSVTHNPIPYHPIIIDNDTMNGSFYAHHRLVYTDINGVYNDTVILPASVIPWEFIIRTYDGNSNQYYYGTGYYWGPPVVQHDFSIYSCPNSGCTAQFIAYPDSINPLTYHFVDMSGASVNSWYWSFGDGTHSFDRNPTHTFLHLGEVHHVCHTVVDSIHSCCDVYCMDIIPGNTGCHANFYFVADTAGSSYPVHFFDASTGSPTSWAWNFGDANSGSMNVSYQQNPSHVFTGSGTFTVCLTIHSDSCFSSYCRNVVITDSVNYHQVYGQVFAGNFPLQLGVAMIFSIDTSQSHVPYVAASTIDSNGVYYFTQVPDGNYVINAIPVFPAGYLPTYYGDVITWEQATHLNLGSPSNPYNIHLVAAGTYNPGGGSTSGQINTSKITNTLIDKITMTLMDVNKVPIAYCRVSPGGGFDFSSLDYGTYYLHPELAGVKGDTIRIDITSAKPHVDVIMTFTGSQILGTGSLFLKNETVKVYPNPVTDQLNLAIMLTKATVVRIDVCMVTGQVISSVSEAVSSGNSILVLPFAGMQDGMYIVKVYSENGINSVSRVIKAR